MFQIALGIVLGFVLLGVVLLGLSHLGKYHGVPSSKEAQGRMVVPGQELIRKLRKEKGITIVELAEKMGVSQARIVEIELGNTIPTAEQRETLQAFIDGRL